jgi:hypothetical protein
MELAWIFYELKYSENNKFNVSTYYVPCFGTQKCILTQYYGFYSGHVISEEKSAMTKFFFAVLGSRNGGGARVSGAGGKVNFAYPHWETKKVNHTTIQFKWNTGSSQ